MSDWGRVRAMFTNRRVRFSVRTVLLLVTLFWVYLGTWQSAKTRVIKDVESYARSNGSSPTEAARPVAPFVVEVSSSTLYTGPLTILHRRQYYVWLFGRVLKLPHDQELSHAEWASLKKRNQRAD